jgi:membrane protein YdbS with pleckstrin-like domain
MTLYICSLIDVFLPLAPFYKKDPTMAFTNLQIDTDVLPQIAELVMQSMSPVYLREVMTQLAIVFTPMFLISWVPWFLPFPEPTVQMLLKFLPLLIGVLALLVSVLAVKQFNVKAYAVRDHDITYRSGLVFRKTVLLPFNRVQHMEVSSGPLQRRFGLASLKFFTAGGSSVDLKIEGLLTEEAERLRAFILQRSQR